MPLLNYTLITIEIRSELPLREPWRLTMIEWPLLQVHVYSSYHFQQFIHWAQQPVLKASLEGKGFWSDLELPISVY